jgi:hypothetical protein
VWIFANGMGGGVPAILGVDAGNSLIATILDVSMA